LSIAARAERNAGTLMQILVRRRDNRLDGIPRMKVKLPQHALHNGYPG
jgi:hypothetical protein